MPIDPRTTPGYYFRRATDPVIRTLLADCPTVFDLKEAVRELFRSELPSHEGAVAPGAILRGEVVVAAGAVVGEGARLDGPVLICPGAYVAPGAHIRDHSVVGPGCRIGSGAEVARSLLTGGVLLKHASFVGDSALGHGVHVGAFAATTGRRTAAGTQEITVRLDGRQIGTGQSEFGAVVGDGVIIPAGTVLQPATLIGPGTVLHPRPRISGFFPAATPAR